MAIRLSYQDRFGSTHAQAYARAEITAISNVGTGASKFRMSYRIDVFASEQSAEDRKFPVDQVNGICDYDVAGESAIEQAYNDAVANISVFADGESC